MIMVMLLMTMLILMMMMLVVIIVTSGPVRLFLGPNALKLKTSATGARAAECPTQRST